MPFRDMSQGDDDSSAAQPRRSSIARTYNYALGGKDHFAADRNMIEQGEQIAPGAKEAGFANRAFIRRVVHHLAANAGIRQFLDLGSGLPTDDNVHEIAHEIDPTARVAYVDNDPAVLAHGRALLAASNTTIVIQADVRQPAEILNNPEIRRHLDFGQPIGVLMFAVLHHVNDHENPWAVTEAVREAICPGSYLAISHFHNPGERMPEVAAIVAECERVFNENLGTGRWRSHDEITRFFDGFDLIEPGLVPVYDWYPDDSVPAIKPDMHHAFVGGVARKP